MEKKETKTYPDSGALFSSNSKNSKEAPDYFGSITINLKDTTAFQVVDGMTVIKLGGWKRQGPTGKTYLALKVNRYLPKEQAAPKPQQEEDDSDIPF